VAKGWVSQHAVLDESGDSSARMGFMKQRAGVAVGFGHASYVGIDLLKLQVASYSGLDKLAVR
jgi:hypothetical protein